MFGNEPVDCALQLIDGFEHAVFQTPAGEFGEETFHSIQPGT
jgi:hypothetical protein